MTNYISRNTYCVSYIGFGNKYKTSTYLVTLNLREKKYIYSLYQEVNVSRSSFIWFLFAWFHFNTTWKFIPLFECVW